MFWNENKECMPREQMRELQGKRPEKKCRRWTCRLTIFAV